jgi:hypothetical protein
MESREQMAQRLLKFQQYGTASKLIAKKPNDIRHG